jgi:hypothetical protein
MKLQELKATCLAAAEDHPSKRGQILDLYYTAEDDSKNGDESFECSLAAIALDELVEDAELDEIIGTEDYLNDTGEEDDNDDE